MELLQTQNLKVHFRVRTGLFSHRQFVHAVNDVSFSIKEKETVGLVGESGCGKSTLGRALIRLIRPTSGKIFFEGKEITNLDGKALRHSRRGFQMIFQDPASSLDPRFTVEQIIGEALDIHRLIPMKQGRRERVHQLLADVGLDPSHAGRYPHEFSGGQRQRIGIARALAVEPKLIVCDEPVSALDVSVQAQIINLLEDLQKERGLSYLFIAHDLAVVEHISDRILVMYLGKIVESGPSTEVCGRPRHPYTKALISAVPSLDASNGQKRIVLEGDLPSPINPPSGCPFHTRCPMAEERCAREMPLFREVEKGRFAACHLAEEVS